MTFSVSMPIGGIDAMQIRSEMDSLEDPSLLSSGPL